MQIDIYGVIDGVFRILFKSFPKKKPYQPQQKLYTSFVTLDELLFSNIIIVFHLLNVHYTCIFCTFSAIRCYFISYL